VKDELNHFLLAVQFLTRLPVGRWLNFKQEDLPKSTFWFPLAGALAGASGALAFVAGRQLFPATVAVLLSMLAMVLITGGLHEDGLADAADGLGGGVTKERALEIMRDSRIGSYGALALWFALAIKFASLLWLAHQASIPLWRILIIAPAVSRASCIVLFSTCENVRENSRTSKPFAKGIGLNRLIATAAYATAGIWLLCGNNFVLFLCVALAWIIATVLCRSYYRRRIGGITGDCLGATIVVSELAVYLAFVAAIFSGWAGK
jgi:adenosylcobinamide-GDP ribazoletransferase